MLHNHETDSIAQQKTTKSSEVKATNVNPTDPEKNTCNSQRFKNQHRTDKFRIVPVMLHFKNKSLRDYAYLDDGSNMTTMEESLANELELHGSTKELCVDWAFGNTHSAIDSKIVTVGISGYYENAPRFKMSNVRTVKHLHLPTQSVTSSWIEQYSHLRNVPIATYDSIKPRILIGLQYSKLIVSLETIEGRENEPIVCKTRLGWVVQGPTFKDDESSESQTFSVNMCVCQSHDNELHQLVKDYFTMENLGVKISDLVLESKEMQRAKHILNTTTVKKGDRYETGLLWKQDAIELPDSYDMALKRLICLENKMAKNPELKANLFDQIEQFVVKKYIRKLSSEEMHNCKYRVWYLPTFPVFNPKKPEKVRLVWDGAAKIKKTSLNSNLLAGPDQLVPLPEIIRRFRERAIAMTGDIKEMYHQVQVREEDQHVQRFLWRNNPTNKPDVYVMMVMTFGSKCSPSVAQYVKNKNASDFKNEFPRATEAIIENHYVDDMIDCTHTVNEAYKLIKDVKMIHQAGGFEIRNFTSNSEELLEKIGEKMDHQNKNLNISIELGTERVLGMFWNTATDNFTYSLKFTKVNEKMVSGEYCPTKREVLQILMSVFDPLGLLANFLVYGKILLQEIWRSNIDWDEKLTLTVRAKWIQWIQALPHVETIQIPRLYSMKLSPNLPTSTQLHTFVDASVEACAAVTYLRIEDHQGIDCCLVGSKTKVAPNKPMSVPRLELQAAVLGTRLADNVKKSQTLKFEKHVFWSDSKTVMGWINSETRRYHQFVAFRIGEILDSTDPKDWRWVPTEHNVADEATKSKIQKADSLSRWYKGPKFLYDKESTWFTEDNEGDYYTEEEMRPCFSMACREVKRIQLVEVKRFSKWNRLVRSMGYVFRFIHNAKAMDRRKGPLMQEEIIKAENYLYGTAQRDYYQDEIIILKHNAKVQIDKQKSLEKSSELFKLSPYSDDNEVLRIRGRIDAAKCLSQDTKRPIILPRRHYITKLIVDHYHRRYKHLNHQTALNEIKQKFDIPALRVVMKEVRNSCQVCKNESAVPQIPEMAELPSARLAAFERPFTYVGIDYFGPFKVKITRNCTAKRWGVLFTCLTTRAIHLEVAHSMTTNSCIICVEKFADRFGDPCEWYSDNGSNFHGLDNELSEEFQKLNLLEIQERFTNSEMKWSFNPPVSPHMGGAWERLIRTVKNCFKKMVTTRNPTDETLPALFCAVENIVNSRPLTYVSLESADDEALTPNHFLLGSSNGRKPICRTTPRDLNQNDWKNIQEQTNQFWKRFVLEYMPTLTKRTKWFKDSKPVKVGDVVLIIDEKNPRNTYPKGIVEQTFVGKGGKRRQAMVRAVLQTKNGPVHKQYRRSVHKLAVLDVNVPANEEVNQLPVESINKGETVGQH